MLGSRPWSACEAGWPAGDRLADLVGAVFLDEVDAGDIVLGLVRPGAAGFALWAAVLARIGEEATVFVFAPAALQRSHTPSVPEQRSCLFGHLPALDQQRTPRSSPGPCMRIAHHGEDGDCGAGVCSRYLTREAVGPALCQRRGQTPKRTNCPGPRPPDGAPKQSQTPPPTEPPTHNRRPALNRPSLRFNPARTPGGIVMSDEETAEAAQDQSRPIPARTW